MAQDFNKALSQLQSMLSTDEGKRDLEKMIGSFTGGDGGNNSPPPQQDINMDDVMESMQAPAPQSNNSQPQNLNNLFGGMSMDSIMKIKSAMDELNSSNDPRSNLLFALKPYMKGNRLNHIDTAIRLMSLGKLPDLIKYIRR